MSDKYAELKQAAEKAIAEEGDVWWDQEQLTRYPDTVEIREAEADFIVSASPATILELLAERDADKRRISDQCGIILSARKFISEYAGFVDVGATEFLRIIDRAAGISLKIEGE